MTPEEMFEVMKRHGSFVMDRTPTLPSPPDVVGPQAIIRFLWMAGTLQQYGQIPYPDRFERNCQVVAMDMFMLLDVMLPQRWIFEKVGSRAPDARVHLAAGAITKDDWETGWLTHGEWEQRRSHLRPGQWGSAGAEPLRSDRPLLRGVDDLREERDQ